MDLAGETGLRPNVVEKDYVLGWLLAAINANEALTSSWVFKGGTCLKKCYFETYRFSEDLDFTLTDGAHLDEPFLVEQFKLIADWVYEACGIEIPVDRLKFDIYENPRGHKSCEGKVYYQSHFSKGKKNIPKIKFDLTADEVLVLPPSRQPVMHPYADEPEGGIHIECYDYPEVFGEKIRALGERGRPRDLYDVINLYRNNQLPSAAVIQNVLQQKCAYKGIELPTLEDVGGYEEALRQNWEPMLAHQLPALPALEVYWETLSDFFAWLLGEVGAVAAQLESVPGEGEIYRPAYGQLRLHSLNGGSLEIIRFAAGNRLCVDLEYTDEDGNHSSRIIEPYSLRQTQNEDILLHAVRAQDGNPRSYRIDRINSVSRVDRGMIPDGTGQKKLSCPTLSSRPLRHH
jgi:predicted nucleotidyltransferase component of viral defense system